MTESCSDQQLLQAYAGDKSDDTFRAIVDRHARWIFAAAFRQLGDRQLAEDAVQIVFILLARRSDKMPTHQKLSGWLFNTLGYTVQNLRRARRRRQMHEERAALEKAMATESPARENDLAIHLDAAVAGLGQGDRDAIVLRFYQDRSFGEIAATLGISEIAARKRVSRGTEKLRKRFEKIGVTKKSDAAVLSVAAIQGIEHVPENLAQSAAHVALVAKAGAAIPVTILTATKGTAYLMAAAKLKIVVAIVIVCLLAVPTAIVSIHYAGALFARDVQKDSAAAPASASTRPALAASYYVLQADQIIQRITDAPADVRNQFLREHSHANPKNIRHFFASTSKAGTSVNLYSTDDNYPLRQLANMICFIRQQPSVEAEIADDFARERLSGDILFRADCSDDECSAGLAKFLHDEFGINAAVAYRDVSRKVIVLHGHWKFKALPQAPTLTDMRQPCIELFGSYPLDKQSKLSGSSETDRPRIARNLGDQLNEQVIIEADGLPEFMSMRSYGEIPGDTANRDLIMQHLQEQTGLTWTEETRTVRRLIIEKGAR
jgi:RNA polymerase sigma factor (sigma-70 family)